jgi:hypothetical protein
MKLFRIGSVDAINECRCVFNVNLFSEVSSERI